MISNSSFFLVGSHATGDQDFTVQEVSGYAGIMGDEYQQSWDALDPRQLTSSLWIGIAFSFF